MTSTTTNARRVDLTITVLNAVNLPKVRVWTPKCSVSITVGVETQVTKRVQGHSPVWNETLSFTQVSTSDVKIQILHGKASPKVIAEAVTSIRSEHLNGKIDEPLKLRLLVSTMAQREAPIIFLSMTSAIPRDHITTTAGTVVVESNLKTLKAVAVTESSTPVPTTELKFSNVLEYIKPFIDIGAAIAELNPYTKLAWALLTVGFKILDALYTRNAQVRDLWKIILECLDFMEQAEPLKAIQNLSGTAQAIIVQLQESVKFLTDYGKKTMTETIFQTLFPGDIDTKIKEFSDNFSQLKTQFDQRVNLDQWKIIQANGEKITIVSTKIDKLLRKSED